MKKFGNVLWGIVLIGIGVIIALNALEVTNFNIFFDGWWTLFIIIPTLIGIIKNESKTWNIIWLVIGIMLLLSAQGILEYKLIAKLILPFILVTIGLSLLFKDALNKQINDRIKTINSEAKEGENFCATFGGVKGDYSNQEFKGASLDAIFGGAELNLSSAIINSDQVINANAIFGGVDIKVPSNVNIKVKSTPIFGGVDNKIQNEYKENIPTIYVNAFCLFGGVDIK